MEITIDQLQLIVKLVVACETRTLTPAMMDAAQPLAEHWGLAWTIANGDKSDLAGVAEDAMTVINYCIYFTDDAGRSKVVVQEASDDNLL